MAVRFISYLCRAVLAFSFAVLFVLASISSALEFVGQARIRCRYHSHRTQFAFPFIDRLGFDPGFWVPVHFRFCFGPAWLSGLRLLHHLLLHQPGFPSFLIRCCRLFAPCQDHHQDSSCLDQNSLPNFSLGSLLVCLRALLLLSPHLLCRLALLDSPLILNRHPTFVDLNLLFEIPHLTSCFTHHLR